MLQPLSLPAAIFARSFRLAPRRDAGNDSNDDGNDQEIGQNDGSDGNDSRVDLVDSVTVVTVKSKMIAAGPFTRRSPPRSRPAPETQMMTIPEMTQMTQKYKNRDRSVCHNPAATRHPCAV